MSRRWTIQLAGAIVLAVLGTAYLLGPWRKPAVPPPVRVQAPFRVVVFSYNTHPVLDTVRTTFEARLRERLSQSGLQVTFRPFNAEGADAKLPQLSSTILRERFDLVVPIATPTSAQLIKDAAADTPIVYSFVTNPEHLGEARRHKNVTGVSDSINYRGNVELVVAWMPSAKRIGMLFNPAEPNSEDAVRRVRPLFEEKGVRVVSAEVRSGADVAKTGRSIASRMDAFFVGGDNTVVGAVPDLVKSAMDHRKPVFASDIGSVESGAVAALSVDYREIGNQTAELAWRVLHDRKAPRELLPVTISGSAVVYNAGALKSMGITIPQEYLSRARAVGR